MLNRFKHRSEDHHRECLNRFEAGEGGLAGLADGVELFAEDDGDAALLGEGRERD